MLNEAPNLNYLWAALVVEELVRCGVETFCISPGSRSAPLATAAAGGGPIRTFVHFDERGTAFHALGHAKATGRPAAFICTSGTAAANAMPAVVEASLAHVPLLVLTADRPPELQDAGANQSIDQVKIYGDYVRWQHVFPCPDLNVPPEYVLTTVDHAYRRALGPPAGPVHLNCMYREPLAPDPVPFDARSYTRDLASWFDGPYTACARAEAAPDKRAMDGVANLLRQTRRGILIIGQLVAPSDVIAAEKLCRLLHWPVFADVASGLRTGPVDGRIVHHFDHLLRSRHAGPIGTATVLLHVGGPVTSKTLLDFIARTPSRNYIRVADHSARHDPVHRVSHRLECGLPHFAAAVEALGPIPMDDEWANELEQASCRVAGRLDEFIRPDAPINEIAAVRVASRLAPAGSVLFLGNSMPVRDADKYAAHDGRRPIVAANRGASGIDGNVATAAGHASGLRTRATAVIGDLALLHDLNSLALLRNTRYPAHLIVLNNDGGGIFSFLPIARHPKHFERFFATPHGLRFKAIAETFGLLYAAPATTSEFEAVYREHLQQPASSIIEITTDRAENVELHRRLDEAIERKLDETE